MFDLQDQDQDPFLSTHGPSVPRMPRDCAVALNVECEESCYVVIEAIEVDSNLKAYVIV